MSDKIRKLSDAIKIGAGYKPKCKYDLFTIDSNGYLRSCVLGAALDAISPNGKRSSVHDLTCRFPELYHPFSNPETFEKINLIHIITNLNDNYDWSREKIADWVQSIGY